MDLTEAMSVLDAGEDLEAIGDAIDTTRIALLMGSACDLAKTSPVGEQHFLLALASLGQAVYHLRLAMYAVRRDTVRG